MATKLQSVLKKKKLSAAQLTIQAIRAGHDISQNTIANAARTGRGSQKTWQIISAVLNVKLDEIVG